MEDAFELLAPFIQDYIYKNKWEELRGIQVEGIYSILKTKDNLLLASQTASGKTEAAFLPILTDLYNNPSNSVGILYISPLKALINDQFLRLTDLLLEVDFKVTKWHGDVSQVEKNKLLRNPSGLLQITPESLESLLMKKRTNVIKLFSDLRYIIIDEVHYFMNSVRGIQLLCILERISRLTSNNPRRVGLSATLGDYTGAINWLNNGTNRDCYVPKLNGDKKKVRLMIEHFYNNVENEKKESEELNEYFSFIYNITLNKKCIIFSNAKADVEATIAYLKRIAEEKRTKDNYFVHHGNISASLREYAEEAMKKSDDKIVTGATVTLELGIDIGELERIVQTGSPMSVSSFVQRLGRAGRRGDPSEMIFVFKEDKIKEDVEFYKLINFEFLMSIAIIELYTKERWIEEIKERKYPYGILFHQTLSFLMSCGEAHPAIIAQNMLTLSPFKYIDQNNFRILVNEMVKENYVEVIDGGKLLLGLKGEAIANNYEFYAVFDADIEYSVKSGSEEIGSISEPYPIGTAFALAGNTWEVKEVNHRQRIIYVNKIKGLSNINWNGKSRYLIHTKVMKKIQEIISLDNDFPYLAIKAKKRLEEIRVIARNANINKKEIIKFNGNTYGIFVWVGTAATNALRYSLEPFVDSVTYIYQGFIPIGLMVKTDLGIDYVKEKIQEIKTSIINVEEFKVQNAEVYSMSGKFDKYIPYELLRQQYLDEFVDIEDLQKNI